MPIRTVTARLFFPTGGTRKWRDDQELGECRKPGEACIEDVSEIAEYADALDAAGTAGGKACAVEWDDGAFEPQCQKCGASMMLP